MRIRSNPNFFLIVDLVLQKLMLTGHISHSVVKFELWGNEVFKLNIPLSADIGAIHTNAFSFGNAYFLIRFRLSSTLKPPETPMKTETFENGFKTGDV